MLNKFVVFGFFLILTKIDGLEILTQGLPFIANYATSINSHVINHNIQTPIIPARLIQPQLLPQKITTFSTFPIQQQNYNKFYNVDVDSQRGNENYQPNDERNESIEVQAAGRSLNQLKNVETSARLQETQEQKRDFNEKNQLLMRENLKSNAPRGFVFHSRVVTDENLAKQDQEQDLKNEGRKDDRNGRDQIKRKEQSQEIRLSPFGRVITF